MENWRVCAVLRLFTFAANFESGNFANSNICLLASYALKSSWLEKNFVNGAALCTLIDNERGWEIVHRDVGSRHGIDAMASLSLLRVASAFRDCSEGELESKLVSWGRASASGL